MHSSAPRSILAASLLLTSSLTLGCSDVGTNQLAIEGSEAVTAGLSTTDGWDVSFTQFVVVVHHPGLVERSDDRPAYVRELGVTVWDVSKALEDGEAISQMIRATDYDGAQFGIAPASASGYEPESGNVDEDVVKAAVDDDWSVHVVGSATNATTMVTVSFDWTFATNTLYRCKFAGDEILSLAADGDETTVIEILGEALLGDGFDAIAAADADSSGDVTQAELESAGLWDAIDSASGEIGGVRGVGACPVVGG